MESNARDRIIPDVQLDGIKGHPQDPQRELAKCFEAYKETYNEIRKLVRRMNSLKIYSCDEYEIYSGSNGFLFDRLELDKFVIGSAFSGAGGQKDGYPAVRRCVCRSQTTLTSIN